MASREYTVWQLAGMAGIASPDTFTSPGAVWLERVARAADDIEDECDPSAGDDVDGMVHEAADGIVPIYTHERWLVFVDLAAYQYESELADCMGDDMTAQAGVILYEIAERLIRELVGEVVDR